MILINIKKMEIEISLPRSKPTKLNKKQMGIDITKYFKESIKNI